MQFSQEQLSAFGAALNEATLLAVDVDAGQRTAALTFDVLSLPPDDGPPPRAHVRLVLQPVGRIAASLRHGDVDDDDARLEEFALDRLPEVVAGFADAQSTLYGWGYLDVPDEQDFTEWKGRLSLDWRSGPGGVSHTLDLFQEAIWTPQRHLDMRFWFDEVRIVGADGREIPFAEFTAGGVRWWRGFFGGDQRTGGLGFSPEVIRIRRIRARIPFARLYELEYLPSGAATAPERRVTRTPSEFLAPICGLGAASASIEEADRRWAEGDRGWAAEHRPAGDAGA